MKTFQKPFVFSFLPLLALFLTFTLLSGCEEEKEDPLAELKATLIGTWQVIPTDEYKPYLDYNTIIEFKTDHTIGLYEPFIDATYNLITEKSLYIKWKDNTGGYVYEISFNEDQTITIYNFEDNSVTEVIKNITFKKIR